MLKKLLITFIALGLIITIIFILYKNKDLTPAIKYQLTLKIDNDNLVKDFFNNVKVEEDKNRAINNWQININNLEELKEKINIEIDNYNIEYLNNFNATYIENLLINNKNKEKIINIFNNKQFIKNIDNETTKRKTYLNYLNDLLKDINYLLNNKKDYYFNDNYYICKDNTMLNYLNELKEKYNLNILTKLGNTNNQKIPVLLYHGVLDNTWGAATLFVKPSEFAKQMAYLKDNNYAPIFVSEIDYAYAFEKPIIITFDDAYVDVYTNAFPILQTYNFKANIFVITGSIGNNLYMNEEMIKDVDKSNLIEIGSHTISHYKLAEKDEQTIEKELKESKEALEKILNKEINTIAYPSGSFNSTVIKIAQKYYSYGLSTLIGKEQSNNINYFKIKRYYVYREYGLNDFIKLL